MASDSSCEPKELRVDGGASANNFLMQFQSDILNIRVIRPAVIETTALGAALLAGLATGVWKSLDEVKGIWREDLSLEPSMNEEKRSELLKGWHRAVERSMKWIEPDGESQ